MLTDNEKRIVASIQDDLPVVNRPYAQIAKRLGFTEKSLLSMLKALRDNGVIRRFGATLRHQKSGFAGNVMAAWQVPETNVDAIGSKMAEFKQVSHCYRRNPTDDWPYNLYTMIHAKSEAACLDIVQTISQKTGVQRYTLLFSKRELKKTSMRYFSRP
ncbi:MAG: Lrp/AsnC family transcriptional regulator [Deltaproteobacteria bacterium]|nr:Lrp/AsnC family transcriptional regulator [Deltaproteobacteria bacterium]